MALPAVGPCLAGGIDRLSGRAFSFGASLRQASGACRKGLLRGQRRLLLPPGRGCGIDLSDITYYVGHETVIARDDGTGLPKWLEALIVLMQRNSVHVSAYFRVPSDALVEIGRQISI